MSHNDTNPQIEDIKATAYYIMHVTCPHHRSLHGIWQQPYNTELYPDWTFVLVTKIIDENVSSCFTDFGQPHSGILIELN